MMQEKQSELKKNHFSERGAHKFVCSWTASHFYFFINLRSLCEPKLTTAVSVLSDLSCRMTDGFYLHTRGTPCLYDAKHTAFDGKLQNEPCVPTHATTVVSALKIMYRMCQKSNHPQVLADNSSMASFACIYCVWILNNYINLPANFIGNKHAVAFIMPLPLDRGIKQLCIWRLSHTSGLSREQGGLGRLKLAQR